FALETMLTVRLRARRALPPALLLLSADDAQREPAVPALLAYQRHPQRQQSVHGLGRVGVADVGGLQPDGADQLLGRRAGVGVAGEEQRRALRRVDEVLPAQRAERAHVAGAG